MLAVRVAVLAKRQFGIVGLEHQVRSICFTVSVLLTKCACRKVSRIWRDVLVLRLKHRQGHHDLASDVDVHGHG